jgi:hypothetical protein
MNSVWRLIRRASTDLSIFLRHYYAVNKRAQQAIVVVTKANFQYDIKINSQLQQMPDRDLCEKRRAMLN